MIWVGSIVSTCGCWSSRTTWVVPPPQYATFSRLVSSITASGSNRPSGHTLVLPDITVDITIDMPDTWNSGYGASRTGGGPAGALNPANAKLRAPMKDCSMRYEMTERCESTAAFGRPVVPLVKMRMKGSSSAIGASGSTAARIVGEAGEVSLCDQQRGVSRAIESLRDASRP